MCYHSNCKTFGFLPVNVIENTIDTFRPYVPKKKKTKFLLRKLLHGELANLQWGKKLCVVMLFVKDAAIGKKKLEYSATFSQWYSA